MKHTKADIERALTEACLVIGNMDCDECVAELFCPINEGVGLSLKDCTKVIKAHFIAKAEGKDKRGKP